MIFSISPRCSGENGCARAAPSVGTAAASTTSATASGRRLSVIGGVLFGIIVPSAWRLVAGDVVGLAPSRASRPGNGVLARAASCARGLDVAAQ